MSSASSLDEKRDVVIASVAEPLLLDDAEHKKLMRRVDWKILPWIYLTYCVVRIDVGNISNAGVMNAEVGHSLKQITKVTAKEWAWVLQIFYFSYMFIEPVSTYFIRLTSPSQWIARIMVSWGIIMVCMAAVHNYSGLLATRFFLGAMEGGYFPAIVYHWAHWYTPFELAPRILGLYAAGAASGAVSGFLAYAISFADSAPMYGWRWLFVIEGLIPIAMGIATLWLLPDFPSTCKWLTAREVEHIALHLHKDAPHETGHTFNRKETFDIFKDGSWYLWTTAWILQAVGGYGVSLVLPQVVKDLGFTTSAQSNLLQIPPAAMTILFLFVTSELLRRKKVNAFPLAIFLDTVVLAMYAILITLKGHPQGKYVAICVLTAAAGCIYPILWPRRVQSFRGTAGAALGIGLHNASAQLSGLLGPQLFRADYAKTGYRLPYIAASGLVAGVILLLIPIWWLNDGDISRFSWSHRIKAQTHVREGDLERHAKLEAFVEGDERRNGRETHSV